MASTREAQPLRKDVIWQAAETAANYHRSRRAIPYADDHFDITERVLIAHGIEVRSVLDLGCGDGLATQAMVDRFPVERAVLVDFSQPMLDGARHRFRESQIAVEIIQGDLLTSEWLTNIGAGPALDLVISRFAIHHLPHDRKRTLYTEILLLLRPGGMFVNIEHVQSPNAAYQAAFERMLIEGIHALSENRETIEETERAFRVRQDAETNILAPVEEQCAWLRQIGFVDVDCSFKAFELAVFGGRKPGQS